MDMIEVEKEIAKATQQLRAELAAAQATLQRFHECIGKAHDFIFDYVDLEPGNERAMQRYECLMSVMTSRFDIPPNLDALHEARARECERLAMKSEQGMLLCSELIEEAAAHRAKKGEGK